MPRLPEESQWVKPTKPTFELIDYIHRRNDGYISIGRKDEQGKFENVVALPANRLPGLFADELQELVDKDGYFSINGMYHYPSLKNKYGLADEQGELLTLPARRGSQHLRCLTSCFVDMDCYQRRLSIGQCIGCFIDAQDEKLVPPASVLCRSGRGVWALWLLVDEEGGVQRGYPDKERAWSKIQAEICKRLYGLGADEAARDCSRFTRIAGSMNRKANTRVDYWFQATAAGKIPTYTLAELSRYFGIAAIVKRDVAKIPSRFETTRGKKGQQQRWYWDYKTFWELIERRDKIAIGLRHNAILVLGVILGRLFREPEILNAKIIQDATRIFQKLEQQQGDCLAIKDVVKQLAKAATAKSSNKNIRHDSIAEYLKITLEEAEILPTLLGRKTSWPCAREFVNFDVAMECKSREKEQQERRALIVGLVGNTTRVPPLRRIQEHLDSMGLSASLRTIRADLQELGVSTGRERTKSDEQQPELPLEE